MEPSVDRLLEAVIDLEPEAQQRFLLEHCTNSELRAQVSALLKDQWIDELLEKPAAQVLEFSWDDETSLAEPPSSRSAPVPIEFGERTDQIRRIGGYSILREIGAGGMGRIFLAEQTSPVSRRVAVKLMKSHHGGPAMLERFLVEGQAMARLDHPNVAHLYDVGTTGDGRPFLVMEHIKGEPISAYCDREQLSIDQRLRLFLQVCAAVQHSHLNRVLHRDLKPSNVLVTTIDGKATVKLIDFGIAQYLDPGGNGASDPLFSGTPSYMSPEALDLIEGGPPVDTRTDVYSLGVLLVEILTGKRPFAESWSSSEGRLERQSPTRPSRGFKAVNFEERRILAGLRSTTHHRLVRALETDLDWIAMRALAYDRNRRYPSCALLAADIDNYLNVEMVHARPPTTLYRFGKLMRRYYKGAAVVLLIIATLTAGFVARTLALIEARQAQEDERQARLQAQAVSDFMAESMVAGARVADPLFGRMVPLAIIENVRTQAADRLITQPLVHAEVLKALAKVAMELTQQDLACDMLEEGLTLNAPHLPADHEDRQEARELIAVCLAEQTTTGAP